MQVGGIATLILMSGALAQAQPLGGWSIASSSIFLFRGGCLAAIHRRSSGAP